MTTELLQAVADVIMIHCYWIRAVSINEHLPYYYVRDGHLMRTTSRCLSLQVTHSRGKNYVGHRWQIPIFRLDCVLAEMRRASPKFRLRCKRLALTEEDVQELILKASYGLIDLDMIDDDYQPIIR